MYIGIRQMLYHHFSGTALAFDETLADHTSIYIRNQFVMFEVVK